MAESRTIILPFTYTITVITVKTRAWGSADQLIIIHHFHTNVLIHANTRIFNWFIRQNKQLMSHCNHKEMLMKNFNEWNKLMNYLNISDLEGVFGVSKLNETSHESP